MNYNPQMEVAVSPERIVPICKNYMPMLPADNYFSKQ
jgi:hypothetical protein